MWTPSSMATLARPVRRVLNSRWSASRAPCIRCCTSLITSLIMLNLFRNDCHHSSFRGHGYVVRDDRPDLLAQQGALNIAVRVEGEDVDRDLTAARQVDGRGVHDLQALGQYALVGEVGDSLSRRILLRIGGVDAVDLRGLEDDLAFQLRGPERGCRVRGEKRIAGAGCADDDASLLQVAYGAAADEGLGHLGHGDGRRHPSVSTAALRPLLQDNGV